MSTSPTWHSGLYVGRVAHRRHLPKSHRLGYRVWHLLLDLDEVELLDKRVRGFGHNRRALVAFDDRDHFGRDERPVRTKLAELLASQGSALPAGRISVLTYPRVLGFVFNPVSFWYLHDGDDHLVMIVAEVNNTFGDQWSYVLDELEAGPRGTVHARAAKVLHVSPFLAIAGHNYTFTIRPPSDAAGSRQAVRMNVFGPAGERVLDAMLVGTRRPLQSRALARVLVTHPLLTLHTVAAIHWQALKILVARKARFHRRPAPPMYVRPISASNRDEPLARPRRSIGDGP